MAEFSEGKKLIRLPRPVRDRADASCDACGSTLPRMLYCLRNQDSGSYFFVGDTCLKELVKLGTILKTFGKKSGQAAYEEEMERRTDEVEPEMPSEQGRNGHFDVPSSQMKQPRVPSADLLIAPTVIIFERQNHYKAFVLLSTTEGAIHSSGSAIATRYEESWHMAEDMSLALVKVSKERPNALTEAIAVAWEQACSRLGGIKQGPLALKREDVGGNGNDLPAWLRTIINLASEVTDDDITESGNGVMVLAAKA